MPCHQRKSFTKGITMIKDAFSLNRDCFLPLICPNQFPLCHALFQLDSNFCCLFNFSAKRLEEVSRASAVTIISSQMEEVLTEDYRDRLQLRSPRGEIQSPLLTNNKVSNPQIFFFPLVLSLRPSLGGLLFNLIFFFFFWLHLSHALGRQAECRGYGALDTDLGSILHPPVSLSLPCLPRDFFLFP